MAGCLPRTALVTGGAKRIGRAISLLLADKGADVVVHCHRSRDEAEETAAEIRRKGRCAWVVSCDLGDPAAADGLISQAMDLCGPIEGLVNNASIFPTDGVLDCSADAIQECAQVNAIAPLMLSRAFARQAGAKSIVHLLDARIADYDARHAAYHLSKRMLGTILRMLARELAPAVRVNGVAPGLILPPPGEDESYLARLASTNPLHSVGAAEDVAEAVCYLFDARFVTGQILFVDGGRHMKGGMYGGV